MAEFKYQAKNTSGQDVTGIVQANNEKIAVSLLRDKGYIVYSVTPNKGSFDLKGITSFRGISDTEKVNFTQNLTAMISAGLPLAQALEILQEQTQSGKMKEVIQSALRDVESGLPLSTALEKFPKTFNKNYISLVRAGEASGTLDKVLKRLADTLEKQRAFKSKVKGAMIYPAIIVLAMVGVFVIIVVFVIPKLAEMYKSIGVDLPLPTKVMIWLSEFMTQKWYLLIALIVGSIVLFKRYAATKVGTYTLAKVSFKLPIFGPILREKDLTEFSRSLSLLIASGVSLIDALDITRDAVGNVIYRDAVSEFESEVKKGNALSSAVGKNKEFPLIVSKMIKVGEETGKTDEILERLSNYFEDIVDNKVKNLSTALEPLIMVVLGLMVGVLIISVITPIYKLTSNF
jgi:type IV pilus assembly protein PilC